MCQSVFFEKPGLRARSVRQPYERLGGDRSCIVWHEGGEEPLPHGDGICLCGVDVPATLAQAGYYAEWESDFPELCS